MTDISQVTFALAHKGNVNMSCFGQARLHPHPSRDLLAQIARRPLPALRPADSSALAGEVGFWSSRRFPTMRGHPLQAIALIEAPDHVSARYRLQAFIPALARAGCTLVLEPIPRGVLERIRLFSRLRRFDVVLLQRHLLPVLEYRFLRRMARRLIYDFDDAMLYQQFLPHPQGPFKRPARAWIQRYRPKRRHGDCRKRVPRGLRN